jgi:hypothetical protein
MGRHTRYIRYVGVLPNMSLFGAILQHVHANPEPGGTLSFVAYVQPFDANTGVTEPQKVVGVERVDQFGI